MLWETVLRLILPKHFVFLLLHQTLTDISYILLGDLHNYNAIINNRYGMQ